MSWTRYRFHADASDFRPVKFPPPGPYWCTGYGEDLEGPYSVIVAYFPNHSKNMREFWPEARSIDVEYVDKITYTDRFPKPKWWKGE